MYLNLKYKDLQKPSFETTAPTLSPPHTSQERLGNPDLGMKTQKVRLGLQSGKGVKWHLA